MKDYNFDEKNQFWIREGFQGIAYSDGESTESNILDTVTNARDLSCLSEELHSSIGDWASEYHLSRTRHCLVRPLPIKPGEKVLELGCGCGAITRYLGEIGAEVIAVDGGVTRAKIASKRCRDLDNVTIVLDNLLEFQSEEEFDWVLLIGVLEYAPVFSSHADPIEDYLNRASHHLGEKGRLVVAIENQLGLKYFNGCTEDHVAIPYYGLNNLYGDKTPITYGKTALKERLTQAGFEALDFYYPYPDYKLPEIIVHESAYRYEQFSISSLISKTLSRDYSGNTYRVFSEPLVAQVLDDNGILEHFSNSFLVVSHKRKEAPHDYTDEKNIVAWAFSCSSRKTRFCTETHFISDLKNNLIVDKRQLVDGKDESITLDSGFVLKHCVKADNYHEGELLYFDILRSISLSASEKEVAQSFSSWFEELKNNSDLQDIADANQLENYYLAGDYMDALPFNYVNTNRALVLFDKEWSVDRAIPLGWVLLRGIIACVPHVASNTKRIDMAPDLADIIHNLAENHGLSVSKESIEKWKHYELSLYKGIQVKPIEYIADRLPVPACTIITAAVIQNQIASLETELSELYESTSWRVTKPVRWLMDKWRRIKDSR